MAFCFFLLCVALCLRIKFSDKHQEDQSTPLHAIQLVRNNLKRKQPDGCSHWPSVKLLRKVCWHSQREQIANTRFWCCLANVADAIVCTTSTSSRTTINAKHPTCKARVERNLQFRSNKNH